VVKERVSLIYWCLVCVHVYFPIMSCFVCVSRVCQWVEDGGNREGVLTVAKLYLHGISVLYAKMVSLTFL